MSIYSKAYRDFLKKDFMLLVIAIVLLFFTFGLWMGVPVFVVGIFLWEINIPPFISIILVLLLISVLFTIFFIPMNIKVAKTIGKIKNRSTLRIFSRLQLIFILSSSVIFSLIFIVIILV
ncbi:hypothetical protein ACQKM9_18000 [Viridibacillus sp. NPDC093762]|uniref:hypothetical protein n=1 Tax=Viridibacillus sp. NPDC093762 TaxID=3390720 RepID=UPI003D0158FD